MQRHQMAIVATFLLWSLFLSNRADAWLRMHYQDADVVARSELIVIGGIKDGSLQYVPHKADGQGFHSWEHHAILLVHEVLKGKCDEKEIPVIIHYGLEPVVGGHQTHDEPTQGSVLPAKMQAVIEIDDDGGSERPDRPVAADARNENIWFLRRLSGEYGEKPGAGDYGIADPEDIQPLSLRAYFLCYLNPSPEVSVRAQMQQQPEIAGRAVRYLNSQEIARIMLESDPQLRVQKLVPYLLNYGDWKNHDAAERGILAAGPMAGAYLWDAYNSTFDENVRERIIGLWGQMRYTGCTDLLIKLLATEDEYWSHQDLKPGWWNADVESDQTRYRRDEYDKMYAAVYALSQMGDVRARPVIEQTRRRWAAIHFENPQIVEACDAALKAFSATATTKP